MAISSRRALLAVAATAVLLLAAVAPAAGEDRKLCKKAKSCIPTSKDYDNLIETPPAAPAQWPKCKGPYVLCSVAFCRILPESGNAMIPLQAECGCLLPVRSGKARGISLVTPNIIKDKEWYDKTVEKCFGGGDPSTANNTCTKTNSAPVCKAINKRKMYDGTWPLISTFTAYEDQGVQVCTGKQDGTSITADCMTAACYKKTAFDGSPFTCYCPVYTVNPNVTYALGYPRSDNPNGINCTQAAGFVISGA
ncbi:MAG: hypothetical protein J3K34DRAFT_444932 [Monoraphidium minutum]|nr:MAG: hypothetical protein J3K34DRAFT_444932 [Monoraphidium minutum]